MKKRLWWSMLLFSTALFTAAAAYGQVGITYPPGLDSGSGSRTPSARIPAGSPASGLQFEGFNSTNYLFTEQFLTQAISPEMAVGPEDIFLLINRRIGRVPNTTSVLNTPTAINPFQFNVAGTGTPILASALLDVWLGPTVQASVCPTVPRTNSSCIITDATLRYDQMHGRFAVLMSVVDTGISTGITGQLAPPTSTRRASWVLVVSRYAAVPQGVVNTSDTFISCSGTGNLPGNPGCSLGGANPNLWQVWYGNNAGGTGFATDGFGGVNGNINAISAVGTTATNGTGAIDGQTFNCGQAAFQSYPLQGANTTPSFCYFPTSVRLGFDNDNIILTASVINANVANVSETNTAFAGTRVRVLKKAAIYTGKGVVTGTLVPGNSYYTNITTPGVLDADFYDLYTTTSATNPASTLAANAMLPTINNGTSTLAAVPIFTLMPSATPHFYDVAHVRGRAQASYTNGFNYFDGSKSTAQNYLVGSYSVVNGQTPATQLLLNPIRYLNTTSIDTFGNPNFGRYVPTLEAAQPVTVDAYTNPTTVQQASSPQVLNAASINVGDARPQRVVFREGHLYIARTVAPSNYNITNTNTTAPIALTTTVVYDVIQKLGATTAFPARRFLSTQWFNGQFYAPMFDVPANVIVTSAVSPINTLPYLEKLFVGTTNTSPLQNTAQLPAVPGALPGAPINSTNACATVNPVNVPTPSYTPVFPSLYDIRCGEAPYETNILALNSSTGFGLPLPPTGASRVQPQATLTSNVFGQRGAAGTDPNDGSLWVYGAYARQPLGTFQGTGQWGTYAANYKMTFQTSDPYNNSMYYFADATAAVPSLGPIGAAAIEILRRQGLGDFAATGAPTLVQTGPAAVNFGPDQPVTRRQMARLVVLSMMDQAHVDNLMSSLGTAGFGSAAYSDVPTNDPGFAYIEIMARLGITRGCGNNDALSFFCPDRYLTRGEMSVFLIRAKLNNVFPTVRNGCPTANIPGCPGAAPGGDNFGTLYVSPSVYFTDITPADPINSPWYIYIQKMKELGITNGTIPPQTTQPATINSPAVITPGIYGLGQIPASVTNIPQAGQTAQQVAANVLLNRGQLAVFLARAFFF